ncbi:hypothetical protein CWI39_2152p0020, partial [Hamiltosporidium magnivora]
MGRIKKVTSENIKSEKIKALNTLKNSAGEIKTCDIEVEMIFERLIPQQTFHNTNNQAIVARLVQSAWFSPYPRFLVPMPLRVDHPTALKNPNIDAILKGNRLIVLHKILDSVAAVEQEWLRSVILAVQKRFERMPRNG